MTSESPAFSLGTESRVERLWEQSRDLRAHNTQRAYLPSHLSPRKTDWGTAQKAMAVGGLKMNRPHPRCLPQSSKDMAG